LSCPSRAFRASHFPPRAAFPSIAIVPRPVFTVRFVAEPGVDAIKSFRALLKTALRRFGLRATDARELHAREDKPQPGRLPMSAFSDRVRSQKKGFFKVADFEGGKEETHVISHLDEEMEMFGKTMDILNFIDTGRQFQLNQTNAEFLLDAFGDDPQAWNGKRVTLHLAEYEYNREKKLGIRLKLPDAPPARAETGDGAVPVKRTRSADLDDEIPF
jgi:hypothetical protein